MSTERRERGEGLLRELSPEGAERLTGFDDIMPELSELIFSYAFGDIYSRPALPPRDRQMVTLSVLAAMGGTERQLDLHIGISLDVGLTREEILECFLAVSVYAGYPRALNAITVARDVFARRDDAAPVAT